MRKRRLRETLAPALYIAAALVQTAPLALHVTGAIPVGNYLAPAVPRLNLWILWWNADRLLHGYRGYWQAPIFHPDPYSFAYSEPLWLPGLVASGFWWTTGSPALAYNAVLLLAFTLNGWAGYYLLRTLHIGFWPSVCGGLVMEMLPIAADQLGVIQSTMLFPVPMMLACVIRFARTGTLLPALGSAVWMAVCYHTSSNTALFFGPIFLLAVGVLAGGRLVEAPPAARLAIAALGAGLLIAPIAVTQSAVLAKVEPSRKEWVIRATSATLAAYERTPPTNLLRRRAPDRTQYSLYPGTGVLVLGAVGVWYGLRRRRLRRWTIYSLVAILTCVLLSFGPLVRDQPLGIVLSAPYELLSAYYPRFRFVRNLWRFGGLAQVFLATSAGFGLAACFGRDPVGSRRTILGGLVTAALLVELFAAPIPLLDLGEDPTRFEWVQWLRKTPADSTIVHLPMASGTSEEEFERTAYWMTCQMYHARRMANGYSAYGPKHTLSLTKVMTGFPDAESLRALRYFGFEHVLAGPVWMTPERQKKLEAWKSEVVPELATNEMTIYRVTGATAASGHGVDPARP